MPSLFVAPDRERVKVQKRGIISVPGDMAIVKCVGRELKPERFPVSGPGRELYHALLAAAKQFVSRQQARGLEYYDSEGIHVYGPYPSYEFRYNMLTGDEYALREGNDPRLAAQLVRQRETAIKAYADYLLVANFLAVPMLTEVPVKENHGSD